MIKLTQSMFKDKAYQTQIMSDEDRYLIAEVNPLHPSSSQYLVYIYERNDEFVVFPFTTQGFKDAIKAFNSLLDKVIELRGFR